MYKYFGIEVLFIKSDAKDSSFMSITGSVLHIPNRVLNWEDYIPLYIDFEDLIMCHDHHARK